MKTVRNLWYERDRTGREREGGGAGADLIGPCGFSNTRTIAVQLHGDSPKLDSQI